MDSAKTAITVSHTFDPEQQLIWLNQRLDKIPYVRPGSAWNRENYDIHAAKDRLIRQLVKALTEAQNG